MLPFGVLRHRGIGTALCSEGGREREREEGEKGGREGRIEGGKGGRKGGREGVREGGRERREERREGGKSGREGEGGRSPHVPVCTHLVVEYHILHLSLFMRHSNP